MAASNRTRQVEEDGAVSTFEYDALNRLTRATYPKDKILALRNRYFEAPQGTTLPGQGGTDGATTPSPGAAPGHGGSGGKSNGGGKGKGLNAPASQTGHGLTLLTATVTGRDTVSSVTFGERERVAMASVSQPAPVVFLAKGGGGGSGGGSGGGGNAGGNGNGHGQGQDNGHGPDNGHGQGQGKGKGRDHAPGRMKKQAEDALAAGLNPTIPRLPDYLMEPSAEVRYTYDAVGNRTSHYNGPKKSNQKLR